MNGGTLMKISHILLEVSGCLCAAGLLIAGTGFFLSGFDYHNLSTYREGTDKSHSYSLEGVTAIRIDIRNQPVTVEHSPDGDFHIFYREDEGDQYTLEAENGSIAVTHRSSTGLDFLLRGLFYNFFVSPRHITVQIPADYAARLNISTTNATVKASDYLFLQEAVFHTTNAPVTLSRIHCTALDVRTTNAQAELTAIEADLAAVSSSNGWLTFQGLQITGELQAKTSNAGLTLEAVNCGRAILKTSNGQVLLTDVQASEYLSARSSNAPIRLENLKSPSTILKTSNGRVEGTIAGDPSTFYIQSQTSNGKNNLPQAGSPTFPNQLEVTTSNADIQVDFA